MDSKPLLSSTPSPTSNPVWPPHINSIPPCALPSQDLYPRSRYNSELSICDGRAAWEERGLIHRCRRGKTLTGKAQLHCESCIEGRSYQAWTCLLCFFCTPHLTNVPLTDSLPKLWTETQVHGRTIVGVVWVHIFIVLVFVFLLLLSCTVTNQLWRLSLPLGSEGRMEKPFNIYTSSSLLPVCLFSFLFLTFLVWLYHRCHHPLPSLAT